MKRFILLFSLVLAITSFQGVLANTDSYPEILLDDNVFVSNIDNPLYTSDILDQVQALDDVDGDISDTIYVILDLYQGNETTMGTYSITFGVKDSNQQVTRSVVYVHVVDVTGPNISGDFEQVTIDINHDPFDLLDGVTCIDNVDGNLIDSVVIDTGDLDYSQYGDYTITYTVEDSSGNNTSVEKRIIIKDMVNPHIESISVIYKEVEDLLTVEDMFHYLSASDNIDGDISSNVVVKEDTYTGNGATVGDYHVTFEVIDSSGNMYSHTLDIHVVSEIPHLLYIDNYLIELNRDEIITNEDIELLLTKLGELDPYKTYAIDVIKDQYTNNNTISGRYDYFVKFISNTGEIVQKNLVIIVDYKTELPVFPGEELPDPWILQHWEVIPLGLVTIAVIYAAVRIFFIRR